MATSSTYTIIKKGFFDEGQGLNMLMITAAFVIMFVFFIMPNQRKSKKEGNFLRALKVGDSVVSIGGIHGVIIDLNDKQILLQMEDGHSRILLARQCISFEATTQTYLEEKEAKGGKKAKAEKAAQAVA